MNERAARSKSRDVPFRAGVSLPSFNPPTHSNPNANLTPSLTQRVTSHAEMTFQICPFGNGTSLRGRHIAGTSHGPATDTSGVKFISPRSDRGQSDIAPRHVRFSGVDVRVPCLSLSCGRVGGADGACQRGDVAPSNQRRDRRLAVNAPSYETNRGGLPPSINGGKRARGECCTRREAQSEQ